MRCLLLGGVLPQDKQGNGGPPVHDGVDITAGGTLLCEAWLCLQLLRKRREHAQVGKIFNVIVAGPLGWISGHGQHVLEHFSLTGLLVGVRLTALLSVVLALPLRPNFRGPPLELPATLSALSEAWSPVGQAGVGVPAGRGGSRTGERAVGRGVCGICVARSNPKGRRLSLAGLSWKGRPASCPGHLTLVELPGDLGHVLTC